MPLLKRVLVADVPEGVKTLQSVLGTEAEILGAKFLDRTWSGSKLGPMSLSIAPAGSFNACRLLFPKSQSFLY